MSELDNVVSITISRETTVVSRAGFGIICVVAYHTFWPERARVYSSLAGLTGDGFPPTHPIYLAAAAIWSQSPKPPTIVVGRRALAPTQTEKLTPAVRNNVRYVVRINTTPFEYTSDSDATDQEIVEGLAAAINTASWVATTAYALGDHVTNDSGKVYVCRTAGTSASAGGPTGTGTGIADNTCAWDYIGPVQAVTASEDDISLNLTADAPGTMFILEPSSDYDGSDVWSREDISTDPGIATDLAAILLANSDWYGLILDTHSKAEILAAAAWVEANNRIQLGTSADTACTTSATDDVASTLKTAARERTGVIYHPKPNQYAGAAWMGKKFPALPGASIWANQTLSGVDAVALTATQLNNLKAKNCNYYTNVGGVNVTMPGKMARPEWIDTIRFIDWLSANMQADVFELFVNAAQGSKVPYDEAGIVLVTGVVQKRLQLGVDAKGLKESPAPTVTAPDLASIPGSDQNNRLLPNVNFVAYLRGAIQYAAISGRVLGAVS